SYVTSENPTRGTCEQGRVKNGQCRAARRGRDPPGAQPGLSDQWGHPGREPGHGRDRGHRAGPRRRGRGRDGRAWARRPARVGGIRLRRSRAGARARAEVADGQRRTCGRDDRLGDRQDLRGRPAGRDRLRGQRLRLLGQDGRRVPRRRAREIQPGAGQGQEAPAALPPARADRRDRTVELPAHELLRGLHTGAEGLRECGLPENVLQIATGRGETGAALVEHVDMIMFTGSTKTGRKVAEEAAKRLIPASLELGGKDPMLVLSDADLERAANFATYYSMQNAGQTCISIERVYVEEPVYDEFGAKVSEKVRALRGGKPEGYGSVEVGAITFPPQLETIKDHVADAVQKGARGLTGGKQVPGAGRFFEPTVIVDVDHTMKCMTEETFGPTLPIMKVHDADEAVRLANNSHYGLGASVFSKDTARGEAIARRLDAGAANVNDAMINYTVLELPMGGAKASGLGSRHGAGGIRKYCSQQAIVVTKLAMKKEPFMYPYKARTSRMLAGLFKFMYGRGKRD